MIILFVHYIVSEKVVFVLLMAKLEASFFFFLLLCIAVIDLSQAGGEGSLTRNAHMLVEFVALKRIIVEIVWIHVTVVVEHAYVFHRALLDTKMNALVIGIGKHTMANLNAHSP
ncbi:hypothetical protein Lser_V15G37711 [Lactuca serriola]